MLTNPSINLQGELVINTRDLTVAELREAVTMLKNHMGNGYPHQKLKLKFSEKAKVRVNRCNEKYLDEAKMDFFEAANGRYCYTVHKRTGFMALTLPLDKIQSISISPQSSCNDKTQKLLNRVHPNAWDNLTVEVSRNMEPVSLNLKSRFPEHVIESLRDAFDNKTPYSYFKPGRNRDLSVETKLCNDGIFRAWYSSEYPGCANGSYYLLINPTTAAFKEDD